MRQWIALIVMDPYNKHFVVRSGVSMVDRDRQRGMLIGLAVGDSLGAAVEFMAPGSFPEVTAFRSGGPHRLKAGEWTDDTIANKGWDLDDQLERYVSWWRGGKYSVNGRCFDIGMTTSASLMRFCQSRNARKSGNASDSSSGNGSIMRLAPVPIAFARFF